MKLLRRALRSCAIGAVGAVLAAAAYTETHRVPGQP